VRSGASDYYEIITCPMDFATIKTMLHNSGQTGMLSGEEGQAACKELAMAMGMNTSLKTLDVSYCGMGAKNLEVLVKFGLTQSRTLIWLDIEGNIGVMNEEEGQAACTALAKAVTTGALLQKLYLGGCSITDGQKDELCKAFGEKSVWNLDRTLIMRQ